MRDIADESGSLDGPSVQDRMAGTGEDQEFADRTEGIRNQTACTPALVGWYRRRLAAEWSASGSALWRERNRRRVLPSLSRRAHGKPGRSASASPCLGWGNSELHWASGSLFGKGLRSGGELPFARSPAAVSHDWAEP